jgi:hypothetical protein
MPTPHEQSLANKFRQATDTFSGDWREGTFEWLKQNAVGSIVEIDLAEKNLDAAWKEAKLNPAAEMKFDIALGLWKNAHVKALNEFKQRTGS